MVFTCFPSKKPSFSQAKEAEAKLAELEAGKAPLLQKLKDLEEIQRLKRAAVTKEALNQGLDELIR